MRDLFLHQVAPHMFDGMSTRNAPPLKSNAPPPEVQCSCSLRPCRGASYCPEVQCAAHGSPHAPNSAVQCRRRESTCTYSGSPEHAARPPISTVLAQIIGIKAKGHDFKIKVLAKEYQHTCKSTGLMLWESAQFMCSLLAENPSIVAGKRVQEIGCGSAGIFAMVAASFAQSVVATDGDAESLDLLRQNTSSNLEAKFLDRILIRKLFWGKENDMKAVRELSGNGAGFDCIKGTDVTNNPDAILPLFKPRPVTGHDWAANLNSSETHRLPPFMFS